jgi:hypothetical protein
MTRARLIGLVVGVLAALPVAVSGQEQPRPAHKARNWSVALRFGGFSDSSDTNRFESIERIAGYDYSPEVTGGLDVSRFIGNLSALTLSFEGLTFAGNAVVMAPVTVTYKFYPLGNGVNPAPGTGPPAVQPWIGAGIGAYAFILDDENITDTRPGGQVSTGLLVPLSRRFDVVGELRYAVAEDARIFSYTLGLGVRF